MSFKSVQTGHWGGAQGKEEGSLVAVPIIPMIGGKGVKPTKEAFVGFTEM